jgi:K+-transporting ATPase KdpF subunit
VTTVFILASILDDVQDLSSIVFAALAFALLVALALFVYLLIALLRPERF